MTNEKIEQYIPGFYQVREYTDLIYRKKVLTQFKMDDLQREIANNVKNQDLSEINEWRIFANSELFSKIIKRFITIIKEIERKNHQEFEYIIALGASGLPIAAVLSQELNRKYFVLDEKFKKLPNSRLCLPDIKDYDLSHTMVLLCDSILRSGYTACNHFKILKNIYQVKQQYLITVLFNQAYFNKVITEDIANLYFYPLLFWNLDFKEKFQQVPNPETITSELFKQLEIQIEPHMLKEIKNQDYETLSFRGKITNLFDEMAKTLEPHLGINRNYCKEVFQSAEKYKLFFSSEKLQNYDTQKHLFNLFLNELDNIKDFKVASFLYPNYFSFTETITDDSFEKYSSMEDKESNPIHKIKIKLNLDVKSERILLDNLLSISLFNSLIELSNYEIHSIFLAKVITALNKLKDRNPKDLFQIFTEICFGNKNQRTYSTNHLEEFVIKIMYSIFEDLFYSERYLKSFDSYEILFSEYPRFWLRIFELLMEEREYKNELIILFYKLLTKITPKIDEKNQISKEYSIPRRLLDVHSYFNVLFNLTDDLDEWRLYSSPQAFRTILLKFNKEIKEILRNTDKNSQIHLFSVGMSGSPPCYCLQQILSKEGYKNVFANFVDEKVFTDEERAVKNLLGNENLEVNGGPIFIFDSVIKTGFNKSYIKKILNYHQIPKETHIYYFVLFNLQKFQNQFEFSSNSFKEYKNFEVRSLYKVDEEDKFASKFVGYEVKPIRYGVELDLETLHTQLKFNTNPYRKKILKNNKKS